MAFWLDKGLRSGAASGSDQKLPQNVESSLDPTHAVPKVPVLRVHTVAEILDLRLHAVDSPRQARLHLLHVLARGAVQVEHDANDDGGGNPLGKFRRSSVSPEDKHSSPEIHPAFREAPPLVVRDLVQRAAGGIQRAIAAVLFRGWGSRGMEIHPWPEVFV